jgi:HAD superfamily phosphatase
MTIVVFDIDGVIRDVSGSYRRALADTVEEFTHGNYRPTQGDIDQLKAEGQWNNDWEASRELIRRYFQGQGQLVEPDFQQVVRFFQSRYRGSDPEVPANWDGYITGEPLLVDLEYFQELSRSQITWGFFSGATRGSAEYILTKRLGIENPVLVAMEDAPGKPDPTGLFQVIEKLTTDSRETVIYLGDTVADMETINRAKQQQPQRPWIAIGIVPPHAHTNPEYPDILKQAGALETLDNVQQLTIKLINQLTSLQNLGIGDG